jgi:hypothetical protein
MVSSEEWWSYSDLLDRMWAERSSWRDAGNIGELVARVSASSPGLIGGNAESEVGDFGLAALRIALSSDYADGKALAQRIRLAALSRPAADYGFGPEWSAYYVSENAAGEQVYALDRFAEPREWTVVGSDSAASLAEESVPALTFDEETGLFRDATTWYLPDQRTVVTQDLMHHRRFHDRDGHTYIQGELWAPGQQVFDQALGRWGRLDGASGEFEYFHDDDQVWEREGTDGWSRWHAAAAAWLPFDRPSGTWLYRSTWLTEPQLDELVRGPAAPAGVTEDPATAESVAAMAALRDEELRAAIAEIRAAQVNPDELSDEEIARLFDAQMMQFLAEDAG